MATIGEDFVNLGDYGTDEDNTLKDYNQENFPEPKDSNFFNSLSNSFLGKTIKDASQNALTGLAAQAGGSLNALLGLPSSHTTNPTVSASGVPTASNPQMASLVSNGVQTSVRPVLFDTTNQGTSFMGILFPIAIVVGLYLLAKKFLFK